MANAHKRRPAVGGLASAVAPVTTAGTAADDDFGRGLPTSLPQRAFGRGAADEVPQVRRIHHDPVADLRRIAAAGEPAQVASQSPGSPLERPGVGETEKLDDLLRAQLDSMGASVRGLTGRRRLSETDDFSAFPSADGDDILGRRLPAAPSPSTRAVSSGADPRWSTPKKRSSGAFDNEALGATMADAVRASQGASTAADPFKPTVSLSAVPPPAKSSLAEVEVPSNGCWRCGVLAVQARALSQALAGLGARCYNWSCGLSSGETRPRELAGTILEYVRPCAHLDASLRELCADLERMCNVDGTALYSTVSEKTVAAASKSTVPLAAAEEPMGRKKVQGGVPLDKPLDKSCPPVGFDAALKPVGAPKEGKRNGASDRVSSPPGSPSTATESTEASTADLQYSRTRRPPMPGEQKDPSRKASSTPRRARRPPDRRESTAAAVSPTPPSRPAPAPSTSVVRGVAVQGASVGGPSLAEPPTSAGAKGTKASPAGGRSPRPRNTAKRSEDATATKNKPGPRFGAGSSNDGGKQLRGRSLDEAPLSPVEEQPPGSPFLLDFDSQVLPVNLDEFVVQQQAIDNHLAMMAENARKREEPSKLSFTERRELFEASAKRSSSCPCTERTSSSGLNEENAGGEERDTAFPRAAFADDASRGDVGNTRIARSTAVFGEALSPEAENDGALPRGVFGGDATRSDVGNSRGVPTVASGEASFSFSAGVPRAAGTTANASWGVTGGTTSSGETANVDGNALPTTLSSAEKMRSSDQVTVQSLVGAKAAAAGEGSAPSAAAVADKEPTKTFVKKPVLKLFGYSWTSGRQNGTAATTGGGGEVPKRTRYVF
eukprot:TRINITY_DN7861_c0_g1_i1.p1 TRINITY_DN7861_c0_g1~~TRINITY_DN7861_c0_g1_i1.p1  ORF type:complete len:835 (+),score=154.20 TRINITY_DN7861_c0_g1_i1:71-2575(+)